MTPLRPGNNVQPRPRRFARIIFFTFIPAALVTGIIAAGVSA